MERKLLSLPSFFVLLLVAGIAFLAAPVMDVHAALTSGNNITVGRKTTPTDQATPANLTTAGDAVFVITFATQAVKVAGETLAGSTVTQAAGFGVEDIVITFAQTMPSVASISRSPLATEFAKADATPTAGQGLSFEVTVPVPDDVQGTLSVGIRAFDSGSVEFQEAANASMTYAATSSLASGNITYNTRDTTVPEAAFAVGLGLTAATGNNAFTATGGLDAADLFQIEITITDNKGIATSGAGAFVVSTMPATSDVKLTTTLANPPATAPTTDPSVIKNSWVKGTATATSVTHVVVIDPADGAATVKIEVMKDSVTDAATPANKIVKTEATVTLSVPPTVMISFMVPPVTDTAQATPVPDPIPTTFTSAIEVTFKLSSEPAASGNDRFLEDDITVTNGTLQAGSLSRDLLTPPTATAAATYTATVTLPAAADRKSPFTIAVAAGRFKSGTLDNIASAESRVVTIPTTTPSTPTTAPTGTTGTALTGNEVGFTFEAAFAQKGFVVLAKSPNDAGFTSALTTEIDIKDEVWQDLRHFLVTTEGGTIDLIGNIGTTPVKQVVISEVMWGNDNGKSDPTSSQWIELYNTTNVAIPSATWTLQFSTKSDGKGMHTGADAKATATALTGALTTTAAPVVDKLSTWRDVGNYWLWEITDTAGGSYGQSGKSTRNSATSPGAPSELISMQRKIDYAKVEKADHVAGTEAAKRAENRNKQLEGVPGTAGGNWEASPEHGYLLTYRKGTPGAKPSIQRHDKTGVARSSVVFNEIANRSDKKHDWIELYNKSSSDKKINGWELSVVSIQDTKRDDRELFTFTAGSNGDDIVVPAKGYLLIVNTDPRNTPLEGGYDVVNPGNSARQSDGAGNKPSRLYYVSDKLDIPEKDFLLILRNGNDKTGTHEKIEDIAGNNPNFPSDADNTDVWPLRVWDLGATNDLGQKNDKTWVRDQGKDVFHGDAWKDGGGFTGVGIDRKYKSSDDYTSGTPGYANNAVQNEVKSDGLTDSNPVIISEIMFATGDGRVPQWIELHNPSDTQAVNLKNWKLEIHNYFGDETLEIEEDATLTLPEVRIQPNQTVLIVSTSTGRNSGADEFPDDRLINIWSNTDLRTALKMQNRRDAILSSIGFYLKLSDPRKVEVDEAGNIDGRRNTNDEPAWALPGGDDDGVRNSMVRDLEGSANDGTVRDAWRDASMVASDAIKADELYYGDDEDVGTPGYTPGGVLPVQLSSFYSKRNDAGAVIITWSTESELDNAGFNILRSLSRVGEFTRINAQLIPGAGTTGEKNTYTWTDTSARPNVVYYYQIEDVSLDGEHRTLRTTRLRGYVGAAGKATTIWGELKSRD